MKCDNEIEMTIDERLDRLVERHEALAQTVQLIASMQVGSEKKLEILTERSIQLTDTVNKLARIVGIHEDTIEDHEGRIGRLEDQK